MVAAYKTTYGKVCLYVLYRCFDCSFGPCMLTLLSCFLCLFYFQDLVRDLKSELTGHFEHLVLAMLMSSARFDAAEIREAIKVGGSSFCSQQLHWFWFCTTNHTMWVIT